MTNNVKIYGVCLSDGTVLESPNKNRLGHCVAFTIAIDLFKIKVTSTYVYTKEV